MEILTESHQGSRELLSSVKKESLLTFASHSSQLVCEWLLSWLRATQTLL